MELAVRDEHPRLLFALRSPRRKRISPGRVEAFLARAEELCQKERDHARPIG
jgi:hypothetical protein